MTETYKLNKTGAQISSDLGLLSGNTATPGQVLTAMGSGTASWQDAPGKTYVAGNNIQISGSTISATDTTYTAGTGISIDADHRINVTNTGGVTSLGGKTGAITLGDSLAISSANILSASIEGTAIKSTNQSSSKVLATDGSGGAYWKTESAGNPEGTSIKSTGISSSNYYLKANGSGGATWSAVSSTSGVTSLGGATGAITLGSGLSMSGNQLSATGGSGSAGVSSFAGKTGDITIDTAALSIDSNKKLSTVPYIGGTYISVNQSTKEISCTAVIPTKTSDLTNDSGFVTNNTASISESQVTNLVSDLSGKASSSDLSSLTTRVGTIEGKESGWDGKSTVTGQDDGTNWTSLTINGTTHSISSVATFG